MQLAQIDPEKFKNYTDDSQRLDDARKSVLAAGGRIVNGSYVIDMDGSPVVVGGAGILHKYRKPNLENDMLFPILGEVLKKSICVNELNPRPKDKTIKNVFVYLGAFAYNNEICPVRIQVNQMRGIREIDRIDVLHSLNTKIGAVASPTGVNSGFNVPLTPAPGTVAALGGLAPALQTEPTISIADLVRIAQPLHPQIFSRDVAAALGVTYRGGELGARYSIISLNGSPLAAVTNIEEVKKLDGASDGDVEAYILSHLEKDIPLLFGGTADINDKSAQHFGWSRYPYRIKNKKHARQFIRARRQTATILHDILSQASADAPQKDYHGGSAKYWHTKKQQFLYLV